MNRPHRVLCALAVASLLVASTAEGQLLYSENFNNGTAASRWSVSQIGGTNAADFAFDYSNSTFNIPAAPRGGGLGLRLDTNTGPTGAISAIMAFPNSQSFTGPHTLSFDLWMQYGTVGATGTTEFAIFGVNHTETTIQAPTAGLGGSTTTPPNVSAVGPSPNGIDFTIVGDNGTNRDVRVYQNGTELLGTLGGYVGSGSTPNLIQETGQAPYTAAYTGPTPGKTPGNQWLQIDVTSLENRTIYTVNGVLWADTSLTTNPGNIMLGTMDLFTSVANQPLFALYDNVTVAVPEPSTVVLGIAGLGGVALLGLRRRAARARGAA